MPSGSVWDSRILVLGFFSNSRDSLVVPIYPPVNCYGTIEAHLILAWSFKSLDTLFESTMSLDQEYEALQRDLQRQ